jgi:hypothetical protein
MLAPPRTRGVLRSNLLGMKRGLIGAVVSAVSLVLVSSATSSGPVLRSVAPLGKHVVVTFAAADLVPGRVVIATSPRIGPTGAFPPATVKLRETVAVQPDATGAARWVTRKALPPGTYYVEVSGFLSGGVTTCLPLRSNCLERWSNVRRVILR